HRPPHRTGDPRGHGVGELLRRLRRHGAVRGLQAVRDGTGQVAARLGEVHGAEDDMDQAVRPRIAVVGPLRIPGAGPVVDRVVERFATSALHLLARVGADPYVVDSSVQDRPDSSHIVRADGVLLLGGGDIDPTLYGVTGPVPELYGVDRAADEHAIAVVREALDTDTPVLGICRGSQVVNVALGGTLVPHIENAQLHRDRERMFLDEEVRLAPDSRVAAWLGKTHATVRSGHHQAVDEPG